MAGGGRGHADGAVRARCVPAGDPTEGGVLLAAQAGLSYLLYFTCSPYATVTNLLLATILLAFRPGPAWLAVGPVLFGEFAVRYWATQDPGMRPYWAVLATAGTGVGLYALCWLHDLTQQRQEAKADVARLEAAQERLRVAWDLCESLCDRLAGLIVVFDRAHAAPDPRAELAAAVHTARDALATVRAVAGDHGRWSLTGELAATGAVLEALGITALIRSDGAALPAPVDELLARALRATVLSWTSEQPPREVRINVADARLRIEGDSSPPVVTGLAAEVAGAGGELNTGPGWLDIRLSATPAASLTPLAAMPWLAWWALHAQLCTFNGGQGGKATGSAVKARWKGPGRQTGSPVGRSSRISGSASRS